MMPHLLVVYSSSLFAKGLTHLLARRADCFLVGTLPIAELTPERLSQVSANVVILEGDEADAATVAAMRVLQARRAAFVLIRVNLSAPMLNVYHCDLPVPAGLDELAGVLRSLADVPTAPPAPLHSAGGPA